MICALDAYIQYLSDFEINSTNIEAFGPSDFLQFGNEAVYISLGLIVNNIKYQHIKISHFYDILQYPNISMLGYRNITKSKIVLWKLWESYNIMTPYYA